MDPLDIKIEKDFWSSLIDRYALRHITEGGRLRHEYRQQFSQALDAAYAPELTQRYQDWREGYQIEGLRLKRAEQDVSAKHAATLAEFAENKENVTRFEGQENQFILDRTQTHEEKARLERIAAQRAFQQGRNEAYEAYKVDMDEARRTVIGRQIARLFRKEITSTSMDEVHRNYEAKLGDLRQTRNNEETRIDESFKGLGDKLKADFRVSMGEQRVNAYETSKARVDEMIEIVARAKHEIKQAQDAHIDHVNSERIESDRTLRNIIDLSIQRAHATRDAIYRLKQGPRIAEMALAA